MTPAQLDPLSVVVLAIGGVIALGCLWYGIAELRLANRVLRSRPDSVLDTPNGGRVELRGTATAAGRLVRSPFTDTPCLAYSYGVEERRDSNNGTSWATIASGDDSVPFRLEDETGSVLIEPPGADFRLRNATRIDVDGGTEPPPRVARYIEDSEDVDCQNSVVDLRLFELKTGTDRRFREWILEPGDEIHVLGVARYDTTVSRDAGQVNAAVGIDEAALSESPLLRLRHHLFGDPFVISDSTERRLGLRAGAYGLGAVILAVVSVTVAVLLAV
ncbi:GIDE domain-containing protein [Natronorubrum sp. DTA28]|uniref:GIDE domain-containing protein n=1 Tax=Natronorubrum sp. DTA28 TaxID=3447019 RepID=UPI003F86C852